MYQTYNNNIVVRYCIFCSLQPLKKNKKNKTKQTKNKKKTIKILVLFALHFIDSHKFDLFRSHNMIFSEKNTNMQTNCYH